MSLKSHVTLVVRLGVSRKWKVNETYLEVEDCLTFYGPRAPTKVKCPPLSLPIAGIPFSESSNAISLY